MKVGDERYFDHPFVQNVFNTNESFYRKVHQEHYPIERLVSRPNREKEDVPKVLAFRQGKSN